MAKIKIIAVIVLIFVILSTIIVSGDNINGTSQTPLESPIGFIEWEKTFDSDYYDKGSCIQQTSDGGVYLCWKWLRL